MKRKVILLIDYDDEVLGKSITEMKSPDGSLINWVGKVTVRKENDMKNFDGPSVFAHELGHVIGHALQLPVPVRNHRANNLFGGVIPLPNGWLIEEEKEAWDFAAKMGVKIDEPTKAEALHSYEVGGL